MWPTYPYFTLKVYYWFTTSLLSGTGRYIGWLKCLLLTASIPPSPAKSTASIHNDPGPSRMRQRFNELMDDAFTLFGSAGSSPDSHNTYTVEEKDSKENKTGKGYLVHASF